LSYGEPARNLLPVQSLEAYSLDCWEKKRALLTYLLAQADSFGLAVPSYTPHTTRFLYRLIGLNAFAITCVTRTLRRKKYLLVIVLLVVVSKNMQQLK